MSDCAFLFVYAKQILNLFLHDNHGQYKHQHCCKCGDGVGWQVSSNSATTRKPRPEEKHDDHYQFLTEEEFNEQIKENKLLEYAKFAGSWYGTPRKPVEERIKNNQMVVLEIDLQGARQIKKAMPESFLVMLKPPSIEELKRRLITRGTESNEELDLRLQVALDEIKAENEFDAVVINEDVQSTVDELIALLGLD